MNVTCFKMSPFMCTNLKYTEFQNVFVVILCSSVTTSIQCRYSIILLLTEIIKSKAAALHKGA